QEAGLIGRAIVGTGARPAIGRDDVQFFAGRAPMVERIGAAGCPRYQLQAARPLLAGDAAKRAVRVHALGRRNYVRALHSGTSTSPSITIDNWSATRAHLRRCLDMRRSLVSGRT